MTSFLQKQTNRYAVPLLRLFHRAQCLRLRLESWFSSLFRSQPRIAVTACWRFPIYSQTFVQQEVTALAHAGFPLRFFYGELGPRSELAHPCAILWSLKRRVFLHRITGADDLAHYRSRMPEKVEALTCRLAHAVGMSESELERQEHYLHAFCFTRMVEAWRADYIHSYFFYEQSLFALVAATLLDLPRGVSCYADHLLQDYALKAMPLHLDDCAILVATSRRIRDELEGLRQAPLDSVLVKPNAVDAQSFPPRPAPGAAAGQREIPLVSICRLDRKKGLEYFIEAVGLLRAEGFPVVAHIIGLADANSPDSLEYERALREQAASPSLAGAVRFLGRCDSHQVREQLQAAGVFVAPFVELPNGDKDGIPTAVLEAMAAGCPIVASDAGSITEIIEPGRDGLMVPQRDAGALAAAIATCLRNPEQARALGRAAAERARAEFDIRVCELAFHDRIRKVVRQARVAESQP
ncbi:glycosyltransferase family 4 protein [Methylomagnum ishizawai]|uniref:glycosyltransferase family 4 protein n=1 Tax=Methylomagnum ishizawai TaxID=1760988 RepID=UPI001C33D84C|nr:glycosyltransferase family 4 protein [Methylomagnum ishizawai]BBL77174.1 colanic acid biosynthesis glycosyltransferase WcaL [Methylomagnum ishizawai]